jgi:parvulin-like peptidyl-prolyl isomerase
MRSLLVGILLVAAANCGLASDLIGKAGSIQIDAAQVRALVAALPEPSRVAVAKDLAALEQMVRADLASRAVLAEAKAAGFERRPEAVAELDRIHEQVLSQLWLASQAQVPASYPGEAEVSVAFNQNQAALQTIAQYRLAQIFVSAPDAADPGKLAQALRKIMDLAPRISVAGADFGKLARENSEQAETAAKDGDLGWLAEDQIMPEALSAVRLLKPSQVAGPVKTAQGFHFIKLLEAKPAQPLTLAQSHERLVTALRARRAQELQQQYLATLGNKLSISINQVELANLQAALR